MATPAQKLVKASDIISSVRRDTYTITALTANLAGVTAESQEVLNKVVETVALNGQPIFIELTSATMMTVSVEHKKSWVDAAALEAALNEMFGSDEFTVAAV